MRRYNKKISFIGICVIICFATVFPFAQAGKTLYELGHGGLANEHRDLVQQSVGAFAQPTGVLWSYAYGYDAGDEAGYSVVETADGGYVVAGYTGSIGAGSRDVWLLKISSQGDWEWDEPFGGTYNDGAYSVKQTADGGYIIAGYTYSYGMGTPDECNALLLKTDSMGNEEWHWNYGDSLRWIARSVDITSDGGYVITGDYSWPYLFSRAGEIFLIKTDSVGAVEDWNHWDFTHLDEGHSVQQTTDGGYIIGGWTGLVMGTPYLDDDALLIKTDSLLNTLWTGVYYEPGADFPFRRGYSVQQTNDGGYILVGERRWDDNTTDGNLDFYSIKTDSLGEVDWSRSYEFYYPFEDNRARSVQQTNDGGYVIAGSSNLTGGPDDIILLKTDAEGDTLWWWELGPGSSDDEGYSCLQTYDGRYVVAGRTNYFGNYRVYLAKIEHIIGIDEKEVVPIESNNRGATIFSGPLLLPEGKKCRFFDITGRVVMLDKMRPGVYFVEIDGQIVRKVIKIR